MGENCEHLSFEERGLLQTQLELGWSPVAIAAGLRRARSTVTREIARNGWKPEPGHHRPATRRGFGCPARVAHKLVSGSALLTALWACCARG